MLHLDQYIALKDRVIKAGYASEVDWAMDVALVEDPDDFWMEYAWVVINSGMKNQVAQRIWDKVRPAVINGDSASSVFRHKGKASAIDTVYKNRGALLKEYLKSKDKLAYLKGLPWIGDTTKFHLAKNLGMDVAKPDRHLVRIAGYEGVDEMCKRLADTSGDRVAAVDTVIWRAANLGYV